MAVETTVWPNFKDKQLRQAYRTEDPIEVAKKVLSLGGEYRRWLDVVSDLNGFGEDDEILEEIAKN